RRRWPPAGASRTSPPSPTSSSSASASASRARPTRDCPSSWPRGRLGPPAGVGYHAGARSETPMTEHDHEPHHDHGHPHIDDPDPPHNAPLSDVQLRVRALESLLTEKGLVDPAALDTLIDTYETKVGPRNGAKVVARAWVDPAFKRRLLDDSTAAIAEM